jgi:hypothetical protein
MWGGLHIGFELDVRPIIQRLMGEILFYQLLGSSVMTEEIRHLGGVMYNLTPSFF